MFIVYYLSEFQYIGFVMFFALKSKKTAKTNLFMSSIPRAHALGYYYVALTGLIISLPACHKALAITRSRQVCQNPLPWMFHVFIFFKFAICHGIKSCPCVSKFCSGHAGFMCF